MPNPKPKEARQKSEIEKVAVEYALAQRVEQKAKVKLEDAEREYKEAEAVADAALERLVKLAGESA